MTHNIEQPVPGNQDDTVRQVSTLELFFDLVFVFTLTQLTHLLTEKLNPLGIVQVLLIFGVSWWMYGGYAWLTNHLPLTRPVHRLLLLLAMGAFLIQALAIPHAFGEAGLEFGFAYLAVVLVHASLFWQATRAITHIAVFNIISALLVIAAGFVHGGPVDYGLWGLGLALQCVTPYISGVSSFRIQPGHFVERHGLLMIVAFGESVVAIGIGAAGLPIDSGLIAATLLGLALVTCLWWAYFVGDNERAEEALTNATPDRRPKLAINGFFYAHIPMLLGVVGIAVGLENAIHHITEPLAFGPAAALAGGTALYLAGDVAFRRILQIGSGITRMVIAVIALGTVPLAAVSAAVQLTALVMLFVTAFIIESVRPASSAYDSGATKNITG